MPICASLTMTSQRNTRHRLNDRIRAIEGVSEAVAIQAVEGYLEIEANRLTSLARNYIGENIAEDGRAVLNASIYCLDDTGFEDYARALGLAPRNSGIQQTQRRL